uniref:ubiquitinyl hydrolase 1 n=1 Tax=Anthurium amnicola TaxID=1678845 RepID=A0A1D1Z6K1_9ARAE
MTRILVQRGSAGSSSNAGRSTQLPAAQVASTSREEEQDREALQESVVLDDLLLEQCGSSEDKPSKADESLPESCQGVRNDAGMDELIGKGKSCHDELVDSSSLVKELGRLKISERPDVEEIEALGIGSSQIDISASYPPPPPVPPPKPSNTGLGSRRSTSGVSSVVRTGSSRRPPAWPVVSARTPPSDSHPSSPRSYGEADGYNSADEQNPCYGPCYDDAEREHLFVLDIRRIKGFEVKRMLEDGNCLFRAVADQVYGDPEAYDMVRQMCIDYMERERDHFSQFVTEGFTSYSKRKRRDKVYGNNVEIQALSEMYNRPIHIYSYSTEPINIFHGGYNTDTPPIRLSYHRGNHYNSLVDPRRLSIGAGLGFSSLRGANIDQDQVKAAIKAQQDQQIDNALLAEGRFYSDLELTEREIEQMVMEASRAEYLAKDKCRQQLGFKDSSSSAEPSSSGTSKSCLLNLHNAETYGNEMLEIRF